MPLRTVYSIRVLLLGNFLVFTVWCIVSLTRYSQLDDSNEWKTKYFEIKKKESRIEQLKQALVNHFPSEATDIKVHVNKNIPTIYAITPTYARWTQKADLTRLANTLLHIPNFHWIVVEDSDHKTSLVTKFLQYSHLKYTHLNAKTDHNYKLKSNDPNWLLPRGVNQRNTGLKWIRENLPRNTEGVLYFMDDDNTYSLRLFEEMRSTNGGSVWPVGLTGGLKFEGPGKCLHGKVLSWYTAWKPDRPFPIDMAAFAVNLKLVFRHEDAVFKNQVPRGYQESHFLTGLKLTKDDMEAKAGDCTEILVWHTRTEKAKMKQEEKLIKMGSPSNPKMEV